MRETPPKSTNPQRERHHNTIAYFREAKPTKTKRMSAEKYIKNYINGALVPAVAGDYLENLTPSTGEVYSYLPDSGPADVDQAVKAAQEAFPGWSNAEPRTRFRLMMRKSAVQFSLFCDSRPAIWVRKPPHGR